MEKVKVSSYKEVEELAMDRGECRTLHRSSSYRIDDIQYVTKVQSVLATLSVTCRS